MNSSFADLAHIAKHNPGFLYVRNAEIYEVALPEQENILVGLKLRSR